MRKSFLLVALFLFFAGVMSRTDSGCPSGYYMVNNNRCEKCAANCQTCTAAENKDCTDCNAGYFKWLGDAVGCYATLPNCKDMCEADNTIGCKGCADGYYPILDVNKTESIICDACAGKISNCKICSDEKTCSSCIGGYYYDTEAKSCKSCIDGCEICVDSSTCTTCKSGNVKGTDNRCNSCGAGCSECDATTPATCTKCIAGAFINSTTKTCKTIANCEEGADDKCTKCKDGYRLKTDGTCIACSGTNVWLCDSKSDTEESIITCKQSKVKTVAGVITTAVACQDALLGCAEQNSDQKCTKCDTDWVLMSGICTLCSKAFVGCATCADGSTTTEGKCIGCKTLEYFNSGTATSVTCTPCPSFCASCNSVGCTACNSDAYNSAIPPAISCAACPPGASSCSDANTAIGCKDNYALGTVGFCRTCSDPNCLECATAYVVCTKCKALYSIKDNGCAKCGTNCGTTLTDGSGCNTNGTGKCDSGKCDPGFLLVTLASSANLNTCAASCDTNCIVGATTLTNCAISGALSCDPGLCKPGYSLISGICTACSANCKTCTSATICTACIDYYSLNASACAAKCTDPNCLNCDGDVGACQTCKDGYLKVDGACNACSANTRTCTPDVNTSTVCYEGYELKTKACAAPCNDAQCTACGVNKATCTACKAGYSVVANACVLCPANCAACTSINTCITCNTGYYNDKTDAVNTVCRTCDSNCTISTDIYCGTTAAAVIISNGACARIAGVSGCREGWGVMGDVGDIKNAVCVACPTNCSECDGLVGKCDTCKATFFKKSDGTDCQMCQMANCATCSQGTGSSTTPSVTGYDKCDTCNSGYIVNTTTRSCENCAANCATCTSAGKCEILCNDGYIKKTDGSGCDACASNCKTCINAGKCEIDCNAGYIKKPDGSGCDACSENCSVCTTAAKCENSCKAGYGLSRQPSIFQQICLPCSTNCAVCTADSRQNTVCTKCITNYYLDSSKFCIAAGDVKCAASDGILCTKCMYGQRIKTDKSGCEDCLLDNSCPITCGGGSTIQPGTGTTNNSTTNSSDSQSSESKLIFNFLILLVVAFLGQFVI